MLKRVCMFLCGLVLIVTGCSTSSDPTSAPSNDPDVDSIISNLDIPWFTAPVKDILPITSFEADEYNGTISWDPPIMDTFVENIEYTATITVIPNDGYTLTGVSANSFRVSGAAIVSHSENSGIITAEFPATIDGCYTSTTIGVLRYVPAGSFLRGYERTKLSVVTKPFRIGEHEITREQFLEIMDADPTNESFSTGMTDPVSEVSWYDAIVFCNKLSIAEGLDPVYFIDGIDFSSLAFDDIPDWEEESETVLALWNSVTAVLENNGYRLPTEMEWMWAAMGATNDRYQHYNGAGINTQGYLKTFAGDSGGNLIHDYTWSGDNSDDKTHPVGSKLPNELGLYDMSGNVLEFCWDWLATYPDGTLTDYANSDPATSRVKRGGGWYYPSTHCDVSARAGCGPQYGYWDSGLRVVRQQT